MINNTTAARIPKFMPFQEAITYYDRTGGDNFVTTSVGKAHRKKIDKDDKNYPPEILVVGELIWSIYIGYLPTEPAPNDYLIDSNNVTWVVTHVIEGMNGQMWEIVTVKGV